MHVPFRGRIGKRIALLGMRSEKGARRLKDLNLVTSSFEMVLPSSGPGKCLNLGSIESKAAGKSFRLVFCLGISKARSKFQ